MVRFSFGAGLAIVLLAGAMGYSGEAQAAWKLPKTRCTASNIGAFGTSTNVVYNANGSVAYTDYATYICEAEGWVLADVTRCFPNGYCVPL